MTNYITYQLLLYFIISFDKYYLICINFINQLLRLACQLVKLSNQDLDSL